MAAITTQQHETMTRLANELRHYVDNPVGDVQTDTEIRRLVYYLEGKGPGRPFLINIADRADRLIKMAQETLDAARGDIYA